MNNQFVPSLHAFRAFAIINIVAIHAFEFIFYMAGTVENGPKEALGYLAWADGILLHDSTLYFTFISGILFSMILAERGYSRFYTSKLNYVVFPYLFFTILYSWRYWGIEGLNTYDGSITDFIFLVANNFATGKANFTFWYIPVLMVLYLFTPLLNKLLAIKKAKWLSIAIILSPLIFSRTWPDTSWTTYIYFIGAYMLGMLVGGNHTKSMELIQKNIILISLVAVVSTAVLTYLFSIEAPKWGMISLTESAWYIQKIAFSALVLLVLERTITKLPRWADVLGSYAFSIYFIHGYLLFELYQLLEKTGVVLNSLPLIVIFALLNLVSVILISVAFTYFVKRLLGHRSRFLIGS